MIREAGPMIPEAGPVNPEDVPPTREVAPMIRVQGLRKSFGRREVLKGVDLRIPRGRITALVGPNASGKTTLIKTVLGLVRPDGGSVEVSGHLLNGDWRYRERIGYMAQDAPLPDNLTAAELFRMMGDLRRAKEDGRQGPPRERAEDPEPSTREPTSPDPVLPDSTLLEAFGLAPELHKPLRTLSGGTRQKVNAVLAFLFDPDLLMLDEPTAGLDPLASGILKARILRERAAGKTVLITSHILPEVEELAEEVAFLLEGTVRFAGSVHQLLRKTGEERLERAVADLMRTDRGAVLEGGHLPEPDEPRRPRDPGARP